MTILHVTESMSAGVVTLLNSLTRRQAELGCSVSVLFIRRPETPSLDQLRDWFHPAVTLVEVQSGSAGVRRLWGLVVALRRCAASGTDVVHLHSSVAGGVGRVALLLRRRGLKVFYSPHGFAFLRTNQPAWILTGTRLAERLLSRMGDGLILTARSEYALARDVLQAPRVFLLQTGVPAASIVPRPRRKPGQRPVQVAMIGRVSYQKAPWRFGAVATALRSDARFTWVGTGDATSVEMWLGGTGVEVIEWLSPEGLHDFLGTVDILLFPSLWEGMSLSLIQAQASGVPAVVSNAIGNVDTIIDGVTGYVCDDETEMVDRVRALILDGEARMRMSEAAIRWAQTGLIDDAIGVDSIALYSANRRRG
ncbi:glycosyltransferase [Plantibacter sp. CFBP 8775]|nr:glycosyltransferase [Plantibacter sp. CFBP 8775]